MKKSSLLKIWKNRSQILEGIKNNIFKKEDVEIIAAERLSICKTCPLFDLTGDGCEVPGTQPCCNKEGGCGCSLAFKTRSLSSSCPLNRWEALLTEQEEDNLNTD